MGAYRRDLQWRVEDRRNLLKTTCSGPLGQRNCTITMKEKTCLVELQRFYMA